MHGIPKNVSVVPVITVCTYVFFPYVLFMCVYVGSYLLI